MDQPPYGMDPNRRRVVLTAIQARCLEQNWTLMAAHVRNNHVHVVIEAGVKPERIMNDLKSCASRCLNRAGLDEDARKRWARHGSTRWLWTREGVAAAIRYVVDEQGPRMATFERLDRSLRSRLGTSVEAFVVPP
jgi:REP element-mobilizing transposase RayT